MDEYYDVLRGFGLQVAALAAAVLAFGRGKVAAEQHPRQTIAAQNPGTVKQEGCLLDS